MKSAVPGLKCNSLMFYSEESKNTSHLDPCCCCAPCISSVAFPSAVTQGPILLSWYPMNDSNMKRHVARQFSFVLLKTLWHVFLLCCHKELYNFGNNSRPSETAISMATQSLEVMVLRYNRGWWWAFESCCLWECVCDFYFHLKE